MIFYVLLILFLTLLFFIWSKRAVYIPQLPGPKWVPILGNTLEIIENSKQIHPWVFAKTQEYKRPWRMGLFNSEPVVHLNGDPTFIQYILKDNFKNYILPDRRVSLLKELFGDGIFASNGENWRLHRKAASHIFTLRNLRDYGTKVLASHATTFINLLQAKCDEGKDRDSNKIVEMQTLYFRYTMDSFSEIAFGESTESLAKESHPFSTAFDRVQRLMTQRFFDPLFRIKQKLGIGREKLIKEDLNTLNNFAAQVIAKRRRDDKDGKIKDDLISQFIKTSRDEITDKELRDIIINFLIAGRDTTACALTWLTYELTQHPEIEKKVLEEMEKVLGADWEKERKGERVEFEPDYYYRRMGELEYTEIVILETLRLHPPVPADDREALVADTLPDGSKVPKGTNIAFNPWQNNRSFIVWGDDALLYNPNRWLDENGQRKEITPFQYPTFSAGPRICLGKSLALLEIKLLLSFLLPRFRFELADKSYVPAPILSIIYQMAPPGLPIYVSPRHLAKGPVGD